jgi:phage terminase Nu1 subunit (DNA packaging protein)
MSELVSKAAYAKRIGCTPAYVHKLCKQGVIPLHDNKIDPDEADAAMLAKRGTTQANNVVTEIPGQHATGMADEMADRDYHALYVKSRALHEEEKARLAKLKADELAGAVLSADQVRLDFFDLAKTVANAILAVPDRLANELAATTEPERVHQALSAELRRCLEDMQEHWERQQTGKGD